MAPPRAADPASERALANGLIMRRYMLMTGKLTVLSALVLLVLAVVSSASMFRTAPKFGQVRA